MAEFDFDAARRWARFDPQKALARRDDNELPFVNVNLIGGQGLLLDTCVYIDQMQDRSPQMPDDLIARRQVNHSTVAIQELMYTAGVPNPSDARSAGVLAEIGKQIKAMPPHRIVLGRAALLSGLRHPDLREELLGEESGPLRRAIYIREDEVVFRNPASAHGGAPAPKPEQEVQEGIPTQQAAAVVWESIGLSHRNVRDLRKSSPAGPDPAGKRRAVSKSSWQIWCGSVSARALVPKGGGWYSP